MQRRPITDETESLDTENRDTSGSEPRYEYQGQGDEQRQAAPEEDHGWSEKKTTFDEVQSFITGKRDTSGFEILRSR